MGAGGEARKLAEAGAAYAGQNQPEGPPAARRRLEDRDAADALEDEETRTPGARWP